MRYYLLLFLLCSTGINAQVNLNSGLVAYYPFNGNAKDESGNNNQPSVVKAGFVADRFNKPNAACSFNGKDNYIRIPDNPRLHFGSALSISAWVMIRDFYEGPCHGNRIIMKGDDDYKAGNFVLTYDDNYATRGQNCYTKMPDKKRQSFYGANATPVTDDYVIPGKWYLLTYIYDGYTASLYVDCKLQARGVNSGFEFTNNDDLYFGRLNNSQFPYWFNGVLDEVRIYNRALNKAEITALCNKENTLSLPDLTCSVENKALAKFDFTVSDCYTVSFKPASARSSKLKAIRWAFGDGSSSTKKAPEHIYTKPGTYYVTAITTSLTGCRDTFSRKIQLQSLQTDYTFTEEGSPGEIQFRVKNNKAAYNWDMGDESQVKGESSFTHAYTKSGRYFASLYAKNNAGCKDTVQKEIVIELPAAITETIVPVPEETPRDFIMIPQTYQLEKRTKEVTQVLEVEQDSVTVTLYDNGIIDGDSITLLYNNSIILFKQLLKTSPLTLRLKINPEIKNNELVMYADNLGSIPPNTALMIVTDGDKRYTVNVSSTQKTNGTVYFSPVKKKTPLSVSQ